MTNSSTMTLAEHTEQSSIARFRAAYGVTPRELEIIQIIVEGHETSQIAKMLWVTEQTVKFHLSNIYLKLGVANRTATAVKWVREVEQS